MCKQAAEGHARNAVACNQRRWRRGNRKTRSSPERCRVDHYAGPCSNLITPSAARERLVSPRDQSRKTANAMLKLCTAPAMKWGHNMAPAPRTVVVHSQGSNTFYWYGLAKQVLATDTYPPTRPQMSNPNRSAPAVMPTRYRLNRGQTKVWLQSSLCASDWQIISR